MSCTIFAGFVKSYLVMQHIVDLHHFHREGGFLDVLKISKVKYSKNWLLVPIWPPKGIQCLPGDDMVQATNDTVFLTIGLYRYIGLEKNRQ